MGSFIDEKRRYIRFRMLALGLLTFEDGTQYKGTVRDISVGGVFIDIPDIDKDKINEKVVAIIHVEIEGKPHAIDAQCKIARVTARGLGLFFHLMDKASKKLFMDILQEIRQRVGR